MTADRICWSATLLRIGRGGVLLTQFDSIDPARVYLNADSELALIKLCCNYFLGMSEYYVAHSVRFECE